MNKKAIVAGVLVDIIGTTIFSFLAGILLAVVFITQGVDEIEFEQVLENTAVMIVGGVIGLFFTFSGGFAAGLIAKQQEVKHGLVVGIIGIIFSLLFSFTMPLWYNITFMILVPIAAVLGGIFSRLIHKTKTQSPEQTNILYP